MLSQLKLQHFKSFVDETLRLNNLTILVGANAVGKSNLLDAIRFLQGVALGMPLADVLRGRWEGGRLLWPGIRGGAADIVHRGAQELSIESQWGLGGGTLRHGISFESGSHPQLTRESLAASPFDSYLFDTHAEALRGKGGRDAGGSIHVALKRKGRGNSPTQTHSAGRSLLHQIDTSPPVSEEVRGARDGLVHAMRAAFFLDITPALMRDYVNKNIENLGLNGENISALTWSICQDPEAKADLIDWLAELCAPELDDIHFAETDLGDVMLVLVEKGDRRIPARSLSDGTLRFLGQLIALRTAPAGSILLIEEIENGLHPTRAHLLVEAMEAATTARDIQVIATTHSPLVLNALSDDALRRAVLVTRPPGDASAHLRCLGELPGFDEVRRRQGVDRMLTSGWLERAA